MGGKKDTSIIVQSLPSRASSGRAHLLMVVLEVGVGKNAGGHAWNEWLRKTHAHCSK